MPEDLQGEVVFITDEEVLAKEGKGGITDVTIPAATTLTLLVPVKRFFISLGKFAIKSAPWIIGAHVIDEGVDGLRIVAKDGKVIGETAQDFAEATGKVLILAAVSIIGVLWARKKFR